MAKRNPQDGRHARVRGTARTRLLDAAVQGFAEHGYSGTSAEEVAERAGVTKGAFYWHFENKRALFLALLEERVDERTREILGAMLVSKACGQAGSEAGCSADDDLRQISLLNHEFWSLAVRDPELGKRYRRRQRSLHQELATELEAVGAGPGGIDREQLAIGLLALVNGLAMEELVDSQAVSAGLRGRLLELMRDGRAPGERPGERSASPPPELGVAKTPAELHSLFAQCFNRGDLDAILSLYEPDATYLATPDERIEGTAAIGEMLGPILAREPQIEMATRFFFPIGDVALLSSHWHATAARESPTGSAAIEGIGTEVARRQAGGTWLYVLDAPNGLWHEGE
jgi:AcrR family transcriptional regulator